MKKFLAFILAAVTLLSLASCANAYKNYEDYIKLENLKDVTISAEHINEHVLESILELRNQYRAAYIEYDKDDAAAKKFDKLNIDYSYKSHEDPDNKDLKLSENTLKGMKATGYNLVLGSDSFIGAYKVEGDEDNIRNNKGFEEQLIGAKKGDKVDVKVTFPDDYSTKELQGVIVVFEVKVNTVSYPAVTSISKDNTEIVVNLTYSFVDPDASEEDKDEETNDEGSANEGGAEAQADEGNDSAKDDDADDKKDSASFSKLFKNGSLKIDFADKEFEKFNTIFEIQDIVNALEGKAMLDEFELVLKVPANVADKTDTKDFADYADRDITVKVTVGDIAALPEWNDEFVKEKTSDKYKTTADYEKDLYDQEAQSMALNAIIDAATVIDLPAKEVKKAYKSAIETEIANELYSYDKSASISDYSQEEFDIIIDKDTYKEIYNAAAESAIKSVKSRLVYEYLFDKLEISLTKKEYNEKLSTYYEENKVYFTYLGLSKLSDVQDYFGKDTLEMEFKAEILADKIVEQITVVD